MNVVDPMKGAQPTPRPNPSIASIAARIALSGDSDALYERHLTFDQVVAGRRRHAARQVRGRRALGPRPAVATLDQDRADLLRRGMRNASTTCRSNS